MPVEVFVGLQDAFDGILAFVLEVQGLRVARAIEGSNKSTAADVNCMIGRVFEE